MTGSSLYKPRPDRWFRFSVRTMLVLVTLFAIGLGWFTAQLKWIHDRHEALDRIAGRHGDIESWPTSTNLTLVIVSRQYDEDPAYVEQDILEGVKIDELAPVRAPGMLPLFREDGMTLISLWKYEQDDSDAFDAEVRELERLFPEAKIFIVPRHKRIGAVPQPAADTATGGGFF